MVTGDQKFQIKKECGSSRIGEIKTEKGVINTPVFFPVMNFITGTTPTSGGFWKYIRNLVLPMNIPLLSQAMHFLDYPNVSGKNLHKWRSKTFYEWYSNLQQPLFIDSGGFKLLTNEEFDIQKFGLDSTPQTIIGLQRDYGGSIIATLDYPLPNNIVDSEAKERMLKSIENAIQTLSTLQKTKDFSTLVFVPIHGRNGSEVSWYIQKFWRCFQKSKIERIFDGFALGSLVPRRSLSKLIIEIALAAKKQLAQLGLENYPLHVFGISSELMPLLVYLGFDSFDSNTFARMALNLTYLQPDTWKGRNIRKLDKIECTCDICSQLNLRKLQKVLGSHITHRKIDGMYKSEYYAMVAVHNLNLHLNEMKETIKALEQNEMEYYLVEFAKQHTKAYEPLTELATSYNRKLQEKLKTNNAVLFTQKSEEALTKQVSLKITPKDFALPDSYIPPQGKDILLLVPCSYEKPYTNSKTFSFIYKNLQSNLDGQFNKIHFVFVSGMFGPVPLEFVHEKPVLNYDYHLTTRNQTGISRVADRLQKFLECSSDYYSCVYAYITSKPYRNVIKSVQNQGMKITLIPNYLKYQSLHEFFRKTNLNELVEVLNNTLLNMK